MSYLIIFSIAWRILTLNPQVDMRVFLRGGHCPLSYGVVLLVHFVLDFAKVAGEDEGRPSPTVKNTVTKCVYTIYITT